MKPPQPSESHDVSAENPDSLGAAPSAAAQIFGERLPLAEQYAHFLATEGITRGLLGPREVPRIWDRHVINSAVLAEAVPHGARVVDVGSGAGLPGIPLAIARSDLRVQLVEPLLRRTTFLEEIVGELGLDIDVIRGRAEEKPVRAAVRGADVVTSRAVAPLGKLVGWSLPLVKVGGSMRALKGSSAEEEIARDAKAIQRAGGGSCSVVEVGNEAQGTAARVVVVPRIR